MNPKTATVLKFWFCLFLLIDGSSHLASLYMRAQGMRPMWVTEPQEPARKLYHAPPAPVPVPIPPADDIKWQDVESGPLFTLSEQWTKRRPQWRCPVHGEIESVLSVIPELGKETHNYCPLCLFELLDKMLPQVEPIPEPEDVTQ